MTIQIKIVDSKQSANNALCIPMTEGSLFSHCANGMSVTSKKDFDEFVLPMLRHHGITVVTQVKEDGTLQRYA